MKVSELLEKLKTKSLPEISRELGLDRTTLPKKLKNLGYAYDRPSNLWYWEGGGMEPLDHDLNTPVKKNVKSEPFKIHKVIHTETPTIHKHDESTSHESNMHVENDSPKIHKHVETVKLPFTQEEIEVLRAVARTWQKEPDEPLYQRSSSLPRGEKTRRTIVIGAYTSKKFDEFAEKYPMITKSDLIEIALMDLMRKYEQPE